MQVKNNQQAAMRKAGAETHSNWRVVGCMPLFTCSPRWPPNSYLGTVSAKEERVVLVPAEEHDNANNGARLVPKWGIIYVQTEPRAVINEA